jgi:hypothetical protein
MLRHHCFFAQVPKQITFYCPKDVEQCDAYIGVFFLNLSTTNVVGVSKGQQSYGKSWSKPDKWVNALEMVELDHPALLE